MADWFRSSSVIVPISEDELLGGEENNNNVAPVDEIPFCARRSSVICCNGCVASSQPLASSVGIDLLRQGANAAEVAIAVSAALCVTEPCSCGLGGDMFCLYYDAKTQKVSAINGSGHSPSKLTLDLVRNDYPSKNKKSNDATNDNIINNNNNDGEEEEEECDIDVDEFRFSPHAVTVPGAARGYEDLLMKHGSGKFTLSELLEPAAKLAEEGFPVAPITSYHWTNGMDQIKKWLSDEDDDNIPLTTDGCNPPKAGDIIINTDLANVLRELGTKGAADGFYGGFPGQAIVDVIQKHGGVMTLEDLKEQTCTFPDPICADYCDIKLWQVPPNGQGIAGLIALKGLGYLQEENCPVVPGTADCYHSMIEMMRLGFADARAHVADIDHMNVSCDTLLNTDRIEKRVDELFNPEKATIAGMPDPSSCTVSFQVVDKAGNAISFVNSNYMGFGTGMVPKNCGFTLQNRGFGFNLEKDHPNVIAPRKRPVSLLFYVMVLNPSSLFLHVIIS